MFVIQTTHHSPSVHWFNNMFTNRSKQNSENETKFVQERIQLAERNFGELSIAFGGYARKAARLRDTGDDLTTALQQYANADHINRSLSTGLAEFAASLHTVNGYADKRVQYIDSKVVGQLTPYESICKHMKDSVKHIFITKDKEVLRQRQLDRIRERNPRNRQQIVEAESELVQAKADVSRTIHSLEDKLIAFEKQKLHDLKEILLDFVCTEIGYHSKAITLLTQAYASIEAIDIDTDLVDLQRTFDELDPNFKSTLRNPQQQNLSQSLSTLPTNSKKQPEQKLKPKQKAASVEVLNKEHSDDSETELTDSYSESEPKTVVRSKKYNQYLQ